MGGVIDAIQRLFARGKDRPPDLDATLADLRARTPTPVFWLLGKTQSDKTSIIRFLTGADDAVVGAGFRPTTRTTRRFDFPTSDAPLLTFLDTRGLDEPGYDPAADIAAIDPVAHLVIVTAKAADFAQGTVHAVLERTRRESPSRPVILCITALHEAVPRQPLPEPYPFAESASKVPDDLRRCIDRHAEAFAGLADALVPIDLTRPEDGFPEPNYGGGYLKETILRLLPAAHRQTLLRLDEATAELKEVHRRHAEPVILAYSTMAATAGAVPVPLLDLVVIPGIQARMAQHLAAVYGQPMTNERLKELAAAVGVGLISRQVSRQLGKLVPVVGSVLGAAAAGAATYAFGIALCRYFESVCEGHVPSAEALRAYYEQQYAAAQQKWKSGGG